MLQKVMAGLNPEQAQVVAHQDGALLVPSVAGSGKTHAVTVRMGRMVADGVRPERILAVTFSKKAAEEMTARAQRYANSRQMRVGTFHSVAYEIVRRERPDLESWTIDEASGYRFCIKDAVGFKGMKWKDADVSFLEQWIVFAKNELALPGSDKAIELAKKVARTNPGKHSNPQLVFEAYEQSEALRKERQLLTFDDMLVEAAMLFRDEGVRSRWASRFDYLIQDEAQDQCFAMMELAEAFARDHRNYMMVGDVNQCHPAGVLIDTDAGKRPIEQLWAAQEQKESSTVRAWNRQSQTMIGGRTVRVGRRAYDGPMYTVRVADRSVPMTSNHKVLARWTDRGSDACVTYLMWREGYGFRVGWCPIFANTATTFHLAQRAKIEKADKVWILTVHGSQTEASMHESIVAARYGLPTVPFEPVTGAQHITTDAIRAIFDAAQADGNQERGERALADHGREIAYPLWPWPPQEGDTDIAYRRDTYFPVYAPNIIPEWMSLPLPDATNTWAPVQSLTSEPYKGLVYSLDVERDHSYAANGIVVLNCIYSWRGAHPETLLNFEKEWGAKVIKMVRNYRSGRAIISAANRVISAMDPSTRMDLTMIAERPQPGETTSRLYTDFDDEADEVSRTMLQLNADGVPWSDMVVLYRVNAQSRAPEEALLSKRIPYRIIGGTNFYERREVKDLLAYLRAAVGARLTDVGRCINSPSRFLGKKFLERVEARVNAAKTAGGPIDWVKLVSAVSDETGVHSGQRTSALEWAKIIHGIRNTIAVGGIEAKPSRLLDKLIMETRYTSWLVQEEGQESTENNRVANVRELVRAADRFATVTELLKYIDLTIESSKRTSNRQPNAVTLMSLHRCIHPDTLVETAEGLLPIRDIAITGEIATAVGPMTYTAKTAYPERDLLTVRTSNGYELTVTPDHGLMVWDGTAYVRRTAENLRVGDFLRLHLGVGVEPRGVAPLPPRPLSDVRAACHSIPSSMTPELAEFLGLFVADGTVYHSGFRLRKQHADVRDRFADLAETLFGCEVKRFDKPRRSGTPGRVYVAEINSTELSAWLRSIGGLSPREKAVPPCILRSTSALQAAFLRGLFEDGTVNLRTASVVDHVAWHTAYEVMGRQVQTMLLRLGMISTRFPTSSGWRVAIHGTHAHTFRDRVGFVSAFKQERLHLSVGPDTRNLVPVDPTWVRNNVSRTAHRLDRQNAIARGYVSRRVASRWGLVDALQWHHDRIASITPTKGPSMCVEVPQHGRFLQSGFDGSNSKGLEYPVVFLLGCNEMVLPHARGDMDEERRLFYVGVTRAKDMLFTSAVRKAATARGIMDIAPSRFLYEANLEPIEPTRTQAAGPVIPKMEDPDKAKPF